jgi:hypothetical protein
MTNMRLMGTALSVFILVVVASGAHSQDAREDLAPCPGSAPEPAQSAAWSVAFCNRTGHDVVLEFHDNDCPVQDWSRRGDVYQRTLHRGESRTFPLCYAAEPAGKKQVPGTPTLRLPGGKGVVTTWTVVGDCGERSKPLNIDTRTFYDRGEYKSGIILLQYPAGASHCSGDASSVAAASASATASAASAAAADPRPAVQPQAPVATHSPVVAPPAAAAATPAPVNNRGSGTPTLTASIDAKDVVGRTVRVFAKDGAGYKCNFNLALTFTDGATWNDRANAEIKAGDADAPIATRKYLKSVSKVQITSSKCSPT